MLENQKKGQNEQGFINLKAIHSMQVGGSIQSVLKDLRNARGEAEHLAKVVNDKRKDLIAQSAAKSVSLPLKEESFDSNNVVNVKASENASEVKKEAAKSSEKIAPASTDAKKIESAFDGSIKVETAQNQSGASNPNAASNSNFKRPFDANRNPNFQRNESSPRPNNFNGNNNSYGNNNPGNFSRPYENNQNRPNNNYVPRPYNNGPRPYDGTQRPYNNGPRPFDNSQRPQTGTGFQNNNGSFQRPQQGGFAGPRPFNNSPRPFGNNGPIQQGQRPQFGQNNFAGGPNRPFSPRPAGSSGFASSRANNFKSFAPTESSSVLAQPERSFGNKNKSPNKNIEEKKAGYVKRNNYRNNIIIQDDEGFNETTMGSRKLIKGKKKEENTFIAPIIDTAIVTAENLSVKELSEKTGRPVTEIIKKLMLLGIMATINSDINFETAELVASDLGVTLEKKIEKTYEEKLSDVVDDLKNDPDAVKRPPIVTIMGHVDHGKTSLLDAIRETAVVNGEAGGITQHIGAYQIVKNNEKITFIDTPGHAAFTAMRARGAKATDIAILVVAADDGVMPQTIEAINHIKAAKVPMIVAINKMDKMDANQEKIKQQLSENGVIPEEWGGDAVLVPISAKTGLGIDKLLNMILLVAEMQELKANPKNLCSGVVLEASLDKNKGPMATILVQNGTLKTGDNIVSGITFGKVRAMYDDKGRQIKVAGPSVPVCVLGFDEVPLAGDQAASVDEKLSKKVIEERKTVIKQKKLETNSGVSLDDFMSKVNEGKLKNLNIIIKGDVQGSVEALKTTLSEISNEEARVVCLHAGAGAVTESDILLASASSAIVIAFNVKTQPKAKSLAEQMKIEIKEYNIIYQAVDDLTASINGMLTPVYEEKIVGHAEVRMVFKLSQSGVVAGSYVLDGKIQRNAFIRIKRNNEEIGSTGVEALKIQKDDKSDVSHGYECGIKLKDFTDIKEGDILECFVKELIKR